MEAFLAITLIFSIPIVAILTSHFRQLKELEIQSRQSKQGEDVRFDNLESELRELRERMNEQALVVEGMRDLILQQAHSARAESEAQQRLNS